MGIHLSVVYVFYSYHKNMNRELRYVQENMPKRHDFSITLLRLLLTQSKLADMRTLNVATTNETVGPLGGTLCKLVPSVDCQCKTSFICKSLILIEFYL